MRSVTRGSFTSSVEPGGWEAAGRWTTSCTSSQGRSEFFPKITWSSREPGGKETKQSHDTGASAILQWRQEREGAVGGEKIDGNELSQVTTSCKLTNHKSLTVFDIQHKRAYTLSNHNMLSAEEHALLP